MIPDVITEFAPAKINLTLHVTGQRDDRYHLLDSLVMFADVGDTLSMATDGKSQLHIEGPESEDVPSDASNSILKTAAHVGADASFHLTKNLPSSAGIGGGTADAAAAFRALHRSAIDPAALSQDQITSLIVQTLALGADVPVCLFSQTAHMSGIGDKLTFHPQLPALYAVLVNPRVPVSTPEIFYRLTSKTNAAMPRLPDHFDHATDLITWISDQRNDMQIPAANLVPEIGDALQEIEYTQGCKLSRMSGSGATCFGLYETQSIAASAAESLAQSHPDWWIKPCVLGG